MGSLEYSNDALDAKSLFYNKPISVYVEGEDDVLFWEYLFNEAEVPAHIEDVGGKKEIIKYIDAIINESADFIVATDRDYNDFTGEIPMNSSIILTYGHSIENSMYSLSKILEVIKKLSRGKLTEEIQKEVKEWFYSIETSLSKLVKYDIANNKFNLGTKVCGYNCGRFLTSKNSVIFSEEKINEFLEQISDQFTEEQLIEVEEQLSQTTKSVLYIIRGHFLTHLFFNAVKKFVKKITGNKLGVNHDLLYTLTVDCSNRKKEKDIKETILLISNLKNL